MSNCLVDDVFYYCNVYRKPFRMPWVKAERCDLTVVLSGEMTYQVGEDIIVLKKNDALLVQPNTAYRRPSGNDLVRYVSFNFTLLPDVILPLSTYMPNAVSQEVRSVLNAITAKYLSHQDCSKEKIISILNYVLFDLSDSVQLTTSNAHVKSIVKYINENLTEKMTLTSISEELGLTKQYTASIFKKETGKTITEYINEKKMLLAKDIILHNEMSLKELAEYLKYDNYNYFSVLFKRCFGVSPRGIKDKIR